MPCINHPNRPIQCGCISLCSECRLSHWASCGCKKKEEAERLKECRKECHKECLAPPNTPEPPKLHLNLPEPPDMKVIAEERIKQREDMISELNHSYNAKLAEIKEEHDREIARCESMTKQITAEIEAEKAREIAEREIIAQQIAERERQLSEAEHEKSKIKEVKKKIKTIKKKIVEVTESKKWDNLSHGRSAIQGSESAVKSAYKPRLPKP